MESEVQSQRPNDCKLKISNWEEVDLSDLVGAGRGRTQSNDTAATSVLPNVYVWVKRRSQIKQNDTPKPCRVTIPLLKVSLLCYTVLKTNGTPWQQSSLLV